MRRSPGEGWGDACGDGIVKSPNSSSSRLLIEGAALTLWKCEHRKAFTR